MRFHEEMKSTLRTLRSRGFVADAPAELDNLEHNEAYMNTDEDRITVKIEYDFIHEHFKKIEKADAILILNYEKNGIAGYIGGNTFLEMGYAFGLGKQVYLLNPIPQMDYYTEMVAIQPVILHGDLSMLSST
jgi:nucleoside 2-deoxyribosyltransferase